MCIVAPLTTPPPQALLAEQRCGRRAWYRKTWVEFASDGTQWQVQNCLRVGLSSRLSYFSGSPGLNISSGQLRMWE